VRKILYVILSLLHDSGLDNVVTGRKVETFRRRDCRNVVGLCSSRRGTRRQRLDPPWQYLRSNLDFKETNGRDQKRFSRRLGAKSFENLISVDPRCLFFLIFCVWFCTMWISRKILSVASFRSFGRNRSPRDEAEMQCLRKVTSKAAVAYPKAVSSSMN
jgi:hypothetical protein